MKKIILICDEELNIENNLWTLPRKNYEILKTKNVEEAISRIICNPLSLLILSRELAVLNAESFFEQIKELDRNLPIILTSTTKDIEELRLFVKLGINDFAFKPIDNDEIVKQILSILKKPENKKIVFQRAEEILPGGSSLAVSKLKCEIYNAETMRIHFHGETGVGKTSFARWSNYVLSRKENKKRPFAHINCACLKRERFVDELFGHVKGAYTGAISEKKGLVELAESGDLFLDEIGELDLECQAELLTFLDNYEYYKLGCSNRQKASVRLISATNKDLAIMVKRGSFRKDLYTRIAQYVIRIPSLRERREDIPELLRHFIRKFTGYDKPFDPALLKIFKNYPWQEGNIREMAAACEYMCNFARKENMISTQHLNKDYFKFPESKFYNLNFSKAFTLGYKRFFKELEADVLCELINPCESIRKNAKKLKIDRATLARKLYEYGIPIRYDHKLYKNLSNS